MFQLLLRSRVASLDVTDFSSPCFFFLKANEADCGFLHFSMYGDCFHIPFYPMTAINEAVVLPKVIAAIAVKKTSSTQTLFPDLGSSPNL